MDTTRHDRPELAVLVRLELPPLPPAGSARAQRLERLQAVQAREAARLHTRVLGRRR